MAESNPIKTQITALKTPLIMTAAGLMVFGIVVLLLHLRSAPAEPPIVEAKTPPASLRNLVFSKEGDGYVMYFSLCDAAGNEIARKGEAMVKISQIGTIGMEGGAQFINEIVLLDNARFTVGLNSYHWFEIEGGFFFHNRQLIIPKRIPASVFKRLPPAGVKCKIAVQFIDAIDSSANPRLERLFLFP